MTDRPVVLYHTSCADVTGWVPGGNGLCRLEAIGARLYKLREE